MLWKVFTDKDTGQELSAYTLDGEAPEEEAETIKLTATEHGKNADKILIRIEERP